MSEIIRIPAHVTHPEAVTAYMDGVRAGIDAERRRTQVDTTEAAIANAKVKREQDKARPGMLWLTMGEVSGRIIIRESGVSIWVKTMGGTLLQEEWYPNSVIERVTFDGEA